MREGHQVVRAAQSLIGFVNLAPQRRGLNAHAQIVVGRGQGCSGLQGPAVVRPVAGQKAGNQGFAQITRFGVTVLLDQQFELVARRQQLLGLVGARAGRGGDLASDGQGVAHQARALIGFDQHRAHLARRHRGRTHKFDHALVGGGQMRNGVFIAPGQAQGRAVAAAHDDDHGIIRSAGQGPAVGLGGRRQRALTIPGIGLGRRQGADDHQGFRRILAIASDHHIAEVLEVNDRGLVVVADGKGCGQLDLGQQGAIIIGAKPRHGGVKSRLFRQGRGGLGRAKGEQGRRERQRGPDPHHLSSRVWPGLRR